MRSAIRIVSEKNTKFRSSDQRKESENVCGLDAATSVVIVAVLRFWGFNVQGDYKIHVLLVCCPIVLEVVVVLNWKESVGDRTGDQSIDPVVNSIVN